MVRMMKKSAFSLIFLSVLGGCTRIIVPGTNDTVILQQPVTREVYYCESDEFVSAAMCAAELEEQGFVRLTDKSVLRTICCRKVPTRPDAIATIRTSRAGKKEWLHESPQSPFRE